MLIESRSHIVYDGHKHDLCLTPLALNDSQIVENREAGREPKRFVWSNAAPGWNDCMVAGML